MTRRGRWVPSCPPLTLNSSHPVSRVSFSDLEYVCKRKQTCRERFLAEMIEISTLAVCRYWLEAIQPVKVWH